MATLKEKVNLKIVINPEWKKQFSIVKKELKKLNSISETLVYYQDHASVKGKK